MAGKYQKERPGKKKVIIFPMLLVAFAAIFVFSIWKIVTERQEREAGVQAYAALAQSAVVVQTPPVTPVEITVEDKEPEETTPEIDVTTASLQVDFEALQAINPQVVGWISSDTGAINYPVVQGKNNDYYLNHMVDGTVNSNGSIFMDFRNDPELRDRNTFIYGHNMLNGAMFASLSQYSVPGYYEQHPELLLVMPEGSYSLQVFAGCVVPGNSDVYQLEYKNDADFEAYIEKVTSLSQFATQVEVGIQDQIVTLSTCAYDYEDARYVLFCKMVAMR